MYGKVMSISDALMWRYYELLTDVSAQEIERMKSDAAAGRAHPMQLKKDLARKIVTDFHSPQAAQQAEQDWASQFQRDEVPQDVEEVKVVLSDVVGPEDMAGGAYKRIKMGRIGEPPPPGKLEKFIRLDKLLRASALSPSRSEAERKIREKAVRVEGEMLDSLSFCTWVPTELTIRVGRAMKRIYLQ
jgi:tyrosyl-tRNA synthetase